MHAWPCIKASIFSLQTFWTAHRYGCTACSSLFSLRIYLVYTYATYMPHTCHICFTHICCICFTYMEHICYIYMLHICNMSPKFLYMSHKCGIYVSIYLTYICHIYDIYMWRTYVTLICTLGKVMNGIFYGRSNCWNTPRKQSQVERWLNVHSVPEKSMVSVLLLT